MTKNSAAPRAKVIAATLGGAVTTIAVWVLELSTSVEVPGTVAGSIATLAAFGFGYITSE